MQMDTRFSHNRSVSICIFLLTVGCGLLAITGCGKKSPIEPTPTVILPTRTQPKPMLVPTPTQIATPRPSQPILPTQTPECFNNLTFINDATIPDGALVSPGSVLDKQWLIQNSGTCNWDYGYRLRFISGELLGASPEYSLYPARAATAANLRIVFTAPLEAGMHVSEWQAFDSMGIPFGDSFYIKVEVLP
jgi:hypothetical protein